MAHKDVEVKINKDYCKKCEICVNICPTHVFALDNEGYPEVVNNDACIDCGLCETHCPDFAVWIKHKEEEDKHPLLDYLRLAHMPTVWCPGCGIGIVFQSLLRVVKKMGIPKDKIVFVSGIGCTARAPGYADFNTLHTTHGRALAFATGVKLANPELTVIAILGDGDGLAIGGNHIIHAARRNIDITAVLVNNFNYGMTGGQVSPTTPDGSYTTTTPYGQLEPQFDSTELVKGAGANYVARGTAYHIKLTDKLIEDGIKTTGFSFIEVVSQCPTYYGRFNKKPQPFDMLEWQKKIVARNPEQGQYKLGLVYRGNKMGIVEGIEKLKERFKNG